MADWVKCTRKSSGVDVFVNLDAAVTIHAQDSGGSVIAFMVADSADGRPVAMRLGVEESPKQIMGAFRERLIS
ncbi:MAG: hypothetical protein J7499_20305 [Sphingopyxis sp.]|nr:hypothetical protein [Sphingopyxis sp.]